MSDESSCLGGGAWRPRSIKTGTLLGDGFEGGPRDRIAGHRPQTDTVDNHVDWHGGGVIVTVVASAAASGHQSHKEDRWLVTRC